MNKVEKDISKVESKLAENLAGENLYKDAYHANITQASRILVDAGLGLYRYSTQHFSGSTVWTFEANNRPPITVTNKGEIIK